MGNTGYRDAVSLWREREKKERNKTRGNEVNRKEGRDCSSNLGNVTHSFVEIISSASPGENAICLLSFPFQISHCFLNRIVLFLINCNPSVGTAHRS